MCHRGRWVTAGTSQLPPHAAAEMELRISIRGEGCRGRAAVSLFLWGWDQCLDWRSGPQGRPFQSLRPECFSGWFTIAEERLARVSGPEARFGTQRFVPFQL